MGHRISFMLYFSSISNASKQALRESGKPPPPEKGKEICQRRGGVKSERETSNAVVKLMTPFFVFCFLFFISSYVDCVLFTEYGRSFVRLNTSRNVFLIYFSRMRLIMHFPFSYKIDCH